MQIQKGFHSPSQHKLNQIYYPPQGQNSQQYQEIIQLSQRQHQPGPYIHKQENNVPRELHQEVQQHVSSKNSIDKDDFISLGNLKEAVKALSQKLKEEWKQDIVDHEKLFIDKYQKEQTSKVKSLEEFKEIFICQLNNQQSQIEDLKYQLNSLKNANKFNDINPEQVQQSQELLNNSFSNQIHNLKEDLLNMNKINQLKKEKIEKLVEEYQTIKESVSTMMKTYDDQIQNLRNTTLKLDQTLHAQITLNEFNRSALIKLQNEEDQTKSKQKISSFESSETFAVDYNQRLKNIQDQINDIYNQSWRKRSAQGEFQLFIRNIENLNELYRNYGIRSSSMKNDLAKICSSFRQARGDGNCFYTAFGFQFFNILLYKYSQINYDEFIKNINQVIKFQINYGQGKSIESQELQQQCWDEFKYRLNYLRKQNQEEFIKHYSAYEQSIDNELIDGCFYGLSTIFFRNIANYLVDNSQMKQAVFDQYNLLIWEEECNSNEVVIDELAKFLQVHVKLVFFETGSFQVREYQQGMQHIIILLIRPGHYNIGYPPESQESERQLY